MTSVEERRDRLVRRLVQLKIVCKEDLKRVSERKKGRGFANLFSKPIGGPGIGRCEKKLLQLGDVFKSELFHQQVSKARFLKVAQPHVCPRLYDFGLRYAVE